MVKLTLLLFFFSMASCAGDNMNLSFGQTFESCLTPETLWEELKLSMEDSSDSRLWPQKLSEIKGEGAHDRSLIWVTYKFPLGSKKYQYKLKDVIEGERLTYSATENHPFKGGATLILERKDDGTVFKWEGSYQDTDFFGRLGFRYYETRFFKAIDANIKKIEKQDCKRKGQ